MDPNANLQEQDRILNARHQPTTDEWLSDPRSWRLAQEDHTRLWELRAAMQGWLAGGGFEPDWTKAPRAAKYYGR